MGTTFTASDVRGLRDLSARLLAVAAAPDLGVWAESVLETVGPVFGADRVFLLIPDGGSVRFEHSDPEMARAVAAYQSTYAPYDIYVTRRRRGLGIHAFVHDQLIRPEEHASSVLWNEYLLGHSLCDPAGISFDFDGVPSIQGLYLYHERSRSGGFGADNLAKLQVLEPVMRTALRLASAWRSRRAALEQNVDRLATPALLLAADGTVAHANRAFRSAVPDRRTEGLVLEGARALARSLARARAGARTASDVLLPGFRTRVIVPPYTFRLRAVELPAGLAGRVLHFLVDVHRDPLSQTLSMGDLAQRFGLTPRQAEVALCLSRRMTNGEIAESLRISAHTARRHTEMVLAKLGVTSRTDVRRVVTTPRASSQT